MSDSQPGESGGRGVPSSGAAHIREQRFSSQADIEAIVAREAQHRHLLAPPRTAPPPH